MHEPADPSALPSHPDLSDEPSHATPQPLRWKKNLVLFLLTIVSVFLAGAMYAGTVSFEGTLRDFLRAIAKAGVTTIAVSGYSYAVPLLAILVTHELGHYVAARIHRVEASLPFFIPLPVLSPFGTMGAIIAMRGRIKSRNALLDIGASGPLAGLAVAIPVLAYGLLHSKVGPVTGPGSLEGQSLLYVGMKRLLLGPIPPGHDVFLSPVAFAGWCGLFVTALNLIPVAQLDGGHVAYALFDVRQNRYALWLHRALLLMFAYNLVKFVGPVLLHWDTDDFWQAISNSLFYLMWFGMLHLMKRMSGRDHPPTEPGELTPGRKVVAAATLALFALLFMPTPWSVY